MKFVDIVPQQVTIAAPAPLVFEMLSQVDYQCLPSSGRTVAVMSHDGDRTIAAFSSQGAQGQSQVVKEIYASPPDCVVYTHLAGPHAGAREQLIVRTGINSTDVTLTARFAVVGTSTYRLPKLTFEYAAHEHLRDVKAAVEARLRLTEHDDVLASMLVQIPTMTTEQQLLEAIDVQEEAEWGHVGHGRGVARVAAGLAESILLPPRQIAMLTRAALLHDIGKVALASSLWGTRGILATEERGIMEAHPRLGADLATRAGLPEAVVSTIRHHHERWDGTGYPSKLAGDEIPLRARIMAISESIDTMMRVSYRRETLWPEQMVAILDEDAGRRWDPGLARGVIRIIRGK
jgi:putative nucleotidyltransferase with HDIG domain